MKRSAGAIAEDIENNLFNALKGRVNKVSLVCVAQEIPRLVVEAYVISPEAYANVKKLVELFKEHSERFAKEVRE